MTTTVTTCPNCGAENSGTGQFCMSCGATLMAGSSATARQLEQAKNAAPLPSIARPSIDNSPLYHGIRTTNTNTLALNQLGALVDSWSDLLDDLGDKAPSLSSTFQRRMAERRIPNVRMGASNLTPGGLSNQERLYQLMRTPTGATMAVRIDQFGRDLFMSWDLWVRPLANWAVILSVLGLAAFFASGTASTPSLFGPAQFSIILWIMGTLFHTFWLGFLVGLAGKVIRGNWLGFFIKQLTPFDVDDITAMTLAVHHSLLEAADSVGISAKLLRQKETFRGGQRERLI